MPTSVTLDLCSVGQVGVNAVDPTKCRVEGKGVKEAEVNKPAEFSLQLADSRGHAVEGPCAVQVRVKSLADGSVSHATVTPAGNGSIKATYTAHTRGRHSVSVQLNGREVVGCQFTMFAHLQLPQMKKPVKRFGGIRGPCGITISKSGEVIAAEWSDRGKVHVFNKLGEKVKTIKHASFKSPCGVANDPDGHIYASSSSPPTVVKFSQDGRTLLVQTKIKCKVDTLMSLRIINEQLFVCSQSDNAVIVFDCRKLEEIRRFGHEGSENGEFNFPTDVVAEKGELYVSDLNNHRIQVFSMEGHFMRSFTVNNTCTLKNLSPLGLSIGPEGLLYVTCNDPDRILAFTLAGECVASIDVKGGPAGIAVDADGFLYVCMNGSNAIEVF